VCSYQTYFLTGCIVNADGSALMRLNDATVVCGAKAKIAKPELNRPNEGLLVCSSLGPFLEPFDDGIL
jgi:exosome complex RNA-binding protein Rrp42 (RNase PH superfamily)